jgi:hypothetical protein
MTGGENTGLVTLYVVIAGLVVVLVKWLADNFISSQRIARTEQAILDEHIKKIESQLPIRTWNESLPSPK